MSEHDLRVILLAAAVILFCLEYVVPQALVPAGLAAFAASFLVPLL